MELRCYCRHVSGKEAVDVPSHNALDVKQVSLTVSSHAESIGSHKESTLLLLKSMERWVVVWGRWDMGFVLRSGYISLKYHCSAKIEVVHLIE